MQLTKSERKFDLKRIEQILVAENKFVTDLFSILALPTRIEESEEFEDEEQNGVDSKQVPKGNKETTRAKSLSELQSRLEAITSKKKLTYKEKMTKKSLKSRLKKKNKQDERNAQAKLLRAEKAMKNDPDAQGENVNNATSSVKPAKPVFNSEGKMVFSKFDFSKIGTKKDKKKQEKDPKKILKNLEKEKEKINDLVEQGEIEKAVEIKEKTAWKNALAKASGEKVKDNPNLLKKTMQRHEQKKRSSKKKWEQRQANVDKMKQDRQTKRTENIQKRKNENKKTKLKKAVKKGKIIPGFS